MVEYAAGSQQGVCSMVKYAAGSGGSVLHGGVCSMVKYAAPAGAGQEREAREQQD